MDDQQFDRLTRAIGAGASRRTLFKGVFGVGAVVALVELLTDSGDAARRGFDGPSLPNTPTPPAPTPTPRPPTPTASAGGGCPCQPGWLCINDGCVLQCDTVDDCAGFANVDCVDVPELGGLCLSPLEDGTCSVLEDCAYSNVCFEGICRPGLG